MRHPKLAALLLGMFCWLATDVAAAEPARLELKPGDKIAVIGNTLADRMQHFAGFETLLHSRFPRHDLVVRNLGFSGDELTLRLRSANFGTPDEHLTGVGADVVLAFFGYNESYGDEAGLAKFKTDLEAFIKHTLAQKYNGSSAPRLVLFSPITHENLQSANLPDGSANNRRLAVYTRAMAEVAKANSVLFVDLLTPTASLYAQAAQPLTINGIHLNETGDWQVGLAIDRALFGPREQLASTPEQLAKLRRAILDKNFHWYQRYRTTDGYSIFGGRADLKFVEGQTNREVMQREMEILKVMTANRDRGVWAAAQGSEFKVDDSNTPDFVPVVTNKPGPLPGGKHVFLGGEEAIGKMTVAKGMKVSLVASEETFPELVNPVQMAFDTKGRLWVAVWESYPHWKPKDEMNDKLLILEDTNGDGKADKCLTFADHLHNPTGFEFWGGGVLVAMAPNLLFLKDTDGDDRADSREIVLSGLDSADTHHAANSFTLDPSGGLYFQEGTFHHSQIESPYAASLRLANAGVFRYEPRTQKIDVYVSYPFANPHGHAFDYWGQDIVVDGTGANPYHAALFSGHVDFPDKHRSTPNVYQPRTRPCPGIEYLHSHHFPDELQGNLLVGNVIGFQGILQYKVFDKGGSYGATEVEPMLSSSDPSFRPADLEFGPDGALYFTDWQNPIIGHMQHNLRDPSRDRTHGRVYRVTWEGRPLTKPQPIAGQPIDKLLDVMKDSDARARYRAKIELSSRPSADVLAGVDAWVKRLNASDASHEHDLLEALWVQQHFNYLDRPLLDRLLKARDFRARAAATRVLSNERDKLSDSLEVLKRLAADEHPRVRLEAVRAASFFTAPEAVEVVAIAAEQSPDEYVKFVSGETLRTLDRYWKPALADGREIHFTTDAGQRYLLRQLSTEQLLKRERTRAVCQELLARGGILDEARLEAVRRLAELDKRAEVEVILAAIGRQDTNSAGADTSVLFDLVRLLVGRSGDELATARAELEKLAASAQQPLVRQIGYVGLVNVDRSTDKAWVLANRSAGALTDFVNAVPLLADASLRSGLYDKLEPLLAGLPAALSSSAKAAGTTGRYVRIELPKRGTLTLAEVEVMSGGKNVAREGKATQKNVAHGADAARAIDGNRKGEFGAGGQTHTEENTASPWWEVDLGRALPIETVTVFNRTDGDLGKRLDGFTLRILDANRSDVFRQDKIAAPRPSVELRVGDVDPATAVRQAAMLALTSMRGQEAKTFTALARFVSDDANRAVAIRALERIAPADWPKDQAAPLLGAVTGYLAKLSPEERTNAEALSAMEFAQTLAGLLPPAEAKRARNQLNELGVPVVRVGTLFERMSYDKDMLVVRAGKPVVFVFDNSDLMPHNFVIAQPGSMEQIGMKAEETAQEPGAAERSYVPKSDKILLASGLLQPRGVEKLSFTAPTAPGVYPYVCTYPGHWRRMYGALYVVEDLDAYLENPESYLAAHPLEIKDPLLADRRPRTEWTFDDLASAVNQLKSGRSYGTGKQIFQVANCIACHKMDGAGNAFGPELAKLDANFKALDVLKELLEPSARINEKFQNYVIELENGKILTGLILNEQGDEVTVIENPLAGNKPVTLKKSEIAQREKSKSSLMPKGLLDKLSREEILDLIAYVLARGNANDPLFKGGHEHGHH